MAEPSVVREASAEERQRPSWWDQHQHLLAQTGRMPFPPRVPFSPAEVVSTDPPSSSAPSSLSTASTRSNSQSSSIQLAFTLRSMENHLHQS